METGENTKPSSFVTETRSDSPTRKVSKYLERVIGGWNALIRSNLLNIVEAKVFLEHFGISIQINERPVVSEVASSFYYFFS
jgi:hypothetical protein